MELKKEEIKWWHINRNMLAVKLGFFLLGMNRSAINPYFTIFLTGVGFSISEAGVITSAKSLGLVLGSLFWSALADKTGARRLIIVVMCTMNLVFTVSQPFVSRWLGPANLNTCPIISKNATAVITMSSKPIVTHNTFYYVFIALNFCENFNSHHGMFLTEVMIRRIQRTSRAANIGQQFMFLSIGFGISATIAGQILKHFPTIALSCYVSVFLYWSVIVVPLFLLLELVFKHEAVFDKRKRKTTEPKEKADVQTITNQNESFSRVLFRTLLDFDLMMNYMTAFVIGFVYTIYLAYTFMFIRSLNAAHILIGLMVAVGSTSAAIVAFLTAWLTSGLGGIWNAYAVAMILSAVRFFSLSVLRNAWLILPLNICIHGLSISLPLTLHIDYIKQRQFPTRVATTLIGIQNALQWGLGPVCGSLFGGWAYQRYGARNLFLISGVVSAVWGLVIMVYALVKHLRGRGEHSLHERRTELDFVIDNKTTAV